MPDRARRIAVLSGGDFSGSATSLVAALQHLGCETIPVRRSRNAVLFHRMLAYGHALALYGARYREYLHRTPSAAKASTLAIHRSLQGLGELDAIIQIQTSFFSFYREKRPGTRYAVFTDHMNLFSKRLPDRGIPIPERYVHASWNRLERAILQAQDHIFVMGGYLKPGMVEEYGIGEGNISVVGAGPNVDVDIERDRAGKDFTSRNILFVGRDPVRKGLGVLEQAFSRIRVAFPDARLHVAGCEGQDADGITYHGRLSGEPLKALFYDSQVFVLPSFREPFGIALIEAMWAKCACIGSRTGAIPELIQEGVSGYLVEPGNVTQMVGGLTRLLDNPGLIRTMAEQGYRHARLRWRWDLTAKRMLDTLFR